MYSVFATSPRLPPPRPPQPTTAISILLLRSRPRTKVGAAATKVLAAAVWRNDRRVMESVIKRLAGGGKSSYELHAGAQFALRTSAIGESVVEFAAETSYAMAKRTSGPQAGVIM